MAMPLKGTRQMLLAPTQVASNTCQASAEVANCDTVFSGLFDVRICKDHESVFTAGFDVVVQVTSDVGDNPQWTDLCVLGRTSVTASASEALTGTEAAGSTVLEVASTTGFAALTKTLIKNGTIANSEWRELASYVPNTSVTVMDPIRNAQTGSTIYSGAEFFRGVVDLSCSQRARVYLKSTGTGQTYVAQVTFDPLEEIK